MLLGSGRMNNKYYAHKVTGATYVAFYRNEVSQDFIDVLTNLLVNECKRYLEYRCFESAQDYLDAADEVNTGESVVINRKLLTGDMFDHFKNNANTSDEMYKLLWVTPK